MKHHYLILKYTMLSLLLLYASLGYTQQRNDGPEVDFNQLSKNFTAIADTVQTTVYWYWISGNISREGVVKDLEAMKKVGINRVFIGNIGLDDVPTGKVKMFSNDWWDILHLALKTATRLNIQVGIFNSPGWSQSGGPWVKPEQSMRYISSVKTTVKGPLLLKRKLESPKAEFQDVKVLAYPAPVGQLEILNLSSLPSIDSLSKMTDNNLNTYAKFPINQTFALDVKLNAPDTVRTLIINSAEQPVKFKGRLYAKENGAFQYIKSFEIDRSNPTLITGFVPYPPAVISIPPGNSNEYRIEFEPITKPAGIAEINFSQIPMVESYAEKTLAKMWPTPHPFWDAYQWPLSSNGGSIHSVNPKSVIDISNFMKPDGSLEWNVPDGNWVIERSGMLSTQVTNAPAPAEGKGLEIDKMSKKHVAAHFDAFLGEIIKRIPAEDRKTWTVAVEDSYETGGQNWTDELIEEFKQKYQYDPVPYIPVMQGTIVGSAEQSDRFLWDLRRLIADDVSFNYVGGLREVSHKNGLTTWLENYGHWGFPGEFLQYGGQSDEIGGEFWSEGDLGDIENRAASSSAHIYGKRKVSAESFTAAGQPFSRYPAIFKKRGDRFFTEGINNTLLHVYIQQPEEEPVPGQSAWFGVEFNRHNTWFYDMDAFLRYIKRCNLMLQQGEYVADVAYFIGEDAPKMTGITEPALPQGYSFDYINADVIKEGLIVKNGRLTLANGISYGILVLPKLETMRPELLAKIKELVNQGATILGPRPKRSPSLANYPYADLKVREMADELWGKINGTSIKANRYGKGMVLSDMDMQQALELQKIIPDMKVSGSDSILFIHRKLKEGSLYFISNQKNSAVAFSAAFRQQGKQPELWDAISGERRFLPDFTQNDSTIVVPLKLAPYQSAFVIFNKGMKNENKLKVNYPKPVKTININKPWLVQFKESSRGPGSPVKFNELTDWSKNPDKRIRYYSGSAQYYNSFYADKISKNAHYILDLGLVKAVAKVSVNGKDIGGVWTPPYQIDISSALKVGQNKIEVKVVNTWLNRLIGDSLLPDHERKTYTQFGPGPKDELQSSGLLGPVRVDIIRY